ncbi:MAG TPA: dTMP kinase, partial [Burkholderiaceae bacterium]
ARERLDATRDLDKFEQERTDFFKDTRAEYLRRAAQFAERFRVIDATVPVDATRDHLRGLVRDLLEGA